MREEPGGIPRYIRHAGITPACAGRTMILDTPMRLTWDHPRVCGKNQQNRQQERSKQGSPPCVREEPVLFRLPRIPCGITPACAGRTSTDKYHWAKSKDHPRVCGKNEQRVKKSTLMLGSPPRVREEQRTDVVLISVGRITPACAGRTLTARKFMR